MHPDENPKADTQDSAPEMTEVQDDPGTGSPNTEVAGDVLAEDGADAPEAPAEMVPVPGPSFDLPAGITDIVPAAGYDFNAPAATADDVVKAGESLDDFDPKADRPTPTEPTEGDPSFDRLAAIAKETGTDPRAIVAAGAAVEDANGDLSADQVLTAVASIKASGAELPGTVTLRVTHGTYCGPGCPDPNARAGFNKGWAYDKAHPAQPGELVTGLSAADAKPLLASKTCAVVK